MNVGAKKIEERKSQIREYCASTQYANTKIT